MQSTYCNRILNQFGMDLAGSAPLPIVSNTGNLILEACESEAEHKGQSIILVDP